MEFYELNRLYDKTLFYMKFSELIDSYLYVLMPVLISFGCGISLINIIVLSTSHSRIHLTSRNYLFSQSIFNFLFQIITSIVFISNYYENTLKNTNRQTYFSLKCLLNFLYNTVLYTQIWLFVIGAFDYCILSIKKFNLHLNSYSKFYVKLFDNLLGYHQYIQQKHQQQQQHQHQQQTHHYKQHDSGKKYNCQSSKANNRKLKVDCELNRNNTFRASSSSVGTNNSFFSPNTGGVDDFVITPVGGVNKHSTYFTYPPVDSYGDDLNGVFEFSQAAAAAAAAAVQDDDDDSSLEIETNRIFCKRKTVIYSIFSIVFFSVLLAFPQIFAYEIKKNQLVISPSAMPNLTSVQMTYPDANKFPQFLYEIYFVGEDSTTTMYDTHGAGMMPDDKQRQNATQINQNEYLFRKLNRTTSHSYSDTVGKALGFSVHIHKHNAHEKKLLATMHSTHAKFFTQIGYFNLVSKQYQFCNIIPNSIESLPNITRFNQRLSRRRRRRRRSVFKYESGINVTEKLSYLNVTVVCIRKNELNTYLAYNTLYFWLEHTMVISVPICIGLVVITSLVYVFINFKKLQTQQGRLIQKRKKLTKSLHRYLNETLMKTNPELSGGSFKNKKKSFKRKSTKTKKPNAKYDVNYINEDFFNELKNVEFYERHLVKKQMEDQNLNKMFILDLFFYIFISFPYTLMRLLLDLFAKDQIKISLDFFIMYKSSLLLFHLHFIIKFFIMITWNRKFRQSLARIFSIQNCCGTNSDDAKPSLCGSIFCFCCNHCYLSRLLGRGRRTNATSIDSAGRNNDVGKLYEDNLYHSTEFNSNYHQYFCPAEPEPDLVNIPQVGTPQKGKAITVTANHQSFEKFNLIENQL